MKCSAHRTYYCCTFSIVHVEAYSCSVVCGAVLHKSVQNKFQIFEKNYTFFQVFIASEVSF